MTLKVLNWLKAMVQWFQEALLEQDQNLVQRKMWEQFRETLLDHKILLEKAQKRQQRKKGRNRKFEGKRKAKNRVNYHEVHDGASEEIGTKTMAD